MMAHAQLRPRMMFCGGVIGLIPLGYDALRDNILSGRLMIPRGTCMLWDAGLLALTIIAHVLFVVGGIGLIAFMLHSARSGDGNMPLWMARLLAAFAAGAVITQAFQIVTLFWPYYWMSAGIEVVAAITAISAAVMFPVTFNRVARSPHPESAQP